jgi:hypothetical protein
MVILGVILALLVSPWLIALSALVGAGLVMAGITGFCGLAQVLARMPWNRPPERPRPPSPGSTLRPNDRMKRPRRQ